MAWFMKILLFGKNGQLGFELQRSLAPLGEVVALGSREQGGNFTQLDHVIQTIRSVKPEVIVNAAAYTAVDQAEKEPELAFQVNAKAPQILAEEAKKIGAWLVHYSTDYVFNGQGKKLWKESDPTGPLNGYGQTKLQGEQAIQAVGCQHLIFRTSWVYAARGKNFAKTMLKLAQERDHLSVVNDQIGAPTGADLLADVTAHALRTALYRPELSGLYHVAAAGETSWYDYARFVIETAQQQGCPLKVGPESIQPVPSHSFPTPAVRPKNSRLDTHHFQHTFGLSLPHWQTGVTRLLTELLEKAL
jgi:dTDP-4-dehydrorhamnose reductase